VSRGPGLALWARGIGPQVRGLGPEVRGLAPRSSAVPGLALEARYLDLEDRDLVAKAALEVQGPGPGGAHTLVRTNVRRPYRGPNKRGKPHIPTQAWEESHIATRAWK